MKMRKNLLAMLLAVVMIAAVVFIAAPNAKAADAPTVITAEAGKTIKLTADAIVNLNGLKNVVIDTNGYKVSLIDTKNVDDLSGDAAGTAKVTGTGTVADWVQHAGGFKYLALENADGTYSAHPFNISITEYGVNTHYSAVSVRVTVIANDKVAKLIDAGEFGLHNYNLANTKNADKEYSPYWKSFKDFTNEDGKYTTHGIHGYFYLENSLTSDVLTDNLFAQVGAYIKIGNLTVESNTKVDIYPKTILTDLNKKVIDEPTLFTEDQKTKMVELIKKTQNEDKQFYFAAYCGNFLKTESESGESGWTLVTDASALKVGDQIVIVAKDYNYALSTTQNNNNRGQASVTKSGNTIEFGDGVQILTLEAGTVANTFAFNAGSGYLYAASSGSNHLKTETALTANSSWTINIADGVATIVAQGSNSRNTMQYNQSSKLFACYSSASQKAIAIYKTSSACTNHEPKEAKVFAPTCTADGYTLNVCLECGATSKDDSVKATGHAWGNVDVDNAATCTTAGSGTKTCSVCGETEATTIPATGHNFVDGKCTNEGCNETQQTTKTWQKATSIKVGDVVTLVYESKKMALSGISTTSTKYGIGTAYTNSLVNPMKLRVVEGSTAGTYAFKTEDGKYLYWTSGNSLATNGTLNANTSWNVSFSNGNVVITNAKNSTRKLQWNASSPRFACYTSEQADIQLYVYK